MAQNLSRVVGTKPLAQTETMHTKYVCCRAALNAWEYSVAFDCLVSDSAVS